MHLVNWNESSKIISVNFCDALSFIRNESNLTIARFNSLEASKLWKWKLVILEGERWNADGRLGNVGKKEPGRISGLINWIRVVGGKTRRKQQYIRQRQVQRVLNVGWNVMKNEPNLWYDGCVAVCCYPHVYKRVPLVAQRPGRDKFNKYKYTGRVDITKVMRIDEDGQNERAKSKYQNIISR